MDLVGQKFQAPSDAHADRLSTSVIIIPTFNAARHWSALHEGLQKQGISASRILIVDSQSTDETRDLVTRAGYRLIVIPKASFRHGRTRQMAAGLFPDAKYLVYITQDAVLAEDAVSYLLRSFDDPKTGAAYGRQLARPSADAIERHGRLFNYPATSVKRDFASRASLGFRSAYFSNSFAAYRRSAFEAAGGFPDHVITSEDVSVAARMLLEGWDIAYCAEARAVHSHGLTLKAEFSRYFDISIHHQQEKWIIEHFGEVGGEGLRFVRSELRYLLKTSPRLLPLAILRSATKWLAYQAGQHQHLLPLWLKLHISSYPAHWREDKTLISAQEAFVHNSDGQRVGR